MSVKLIHSNRFGYITKCRCCQEIQCSFGTIILMFTRSDFEAFREHFFRFKEIESAPLHRDGIENRYVIDTSCVGLKLSLSRQEYNLVADLLNMASLEFQLEDELNMD